MPTRNTRYFFCGIGGSGMLPLAMIMKGRGFDISGSDRSNDQGRSPDKFEFLANQGIHLSPQDGSGLEPNMLLVVSTAIEDSIPEVKIARERNSPVLKRSQLLASLFNDAEQRIAIAGTSGKSTTTGMLGYVLHELGLSPTVMNGAVFKNFQTDENPFATSLTGEGKIFVTEADESDGSIALYDPTIAVLNNISLDHKSLVELKSLFADFIGKAPVSVLNFDNENVRELASGYQGTVISYSLQGEAVLSAKNIEQHASGSECEISCDGLDYKLKLNVPGLHNISNALAALSCLYALGCDMAEACRLMTGFSGVKRRMEVVGEQSGVTVIDDFAHNPDKIEASLQTLKQFPGRLLIIFQMHGFGPLKLMHKELADVFARYLNGDDRIFMPEVLYLGGSADRSYTAKDFVSELQAKSVYASWFPDREEIKSEITDVAKPYDRIIIMGARDDTLSAFAREILAGL